MGEFLLVAQSVVLTHEAPELASSIDDWEVLEDFVLIQWIVDL